MSTKQNILSVAEELCARQIKAIPGREAMLAQALLEAESLLRGIVEIGKRDMSNPKYDSVFTDARAFLDKVGK